ncbi:PEGA domain-containing protein [Methanoregula sp.]|uniref:PEGA domain-containing protein n=1 Tax=Methanoregula sp. TaxID=2052170 RepID=UPI00356635D5
MKHWNLYAGILLLFVLVGAAAASGSMQSYLGNTIKLSGYCYSSSTVYLFLTGPNLPTNGVALDNIYRRADQGGFTEVSVDDHDRWEYNWGTNSLGGGLDAGTYTVWAVNSPNDRSHLGETEYSTISVSLGNPSISVVTPAVPGSFDLRSVPDNTSVVINGNYKGSTPLTVSGLDPGKYTITFSRFDYEKFSTTATIEAGAITEVTATLQPKTGSLVINTTPSGAQILLDGNNVGTAPVTRTNLAAGNHTINATLDGYIPVEEQVRVIADQSVTSTIELEKPSVIPGMTTPVPIPVTIGACSCAILIFAFCRLRAGP